MAMNKYMHPRNIYKSPPNFKQLAIDYPEFRKYVKQDVSGKITLDFKDLDALRSLSSTLLKKDFNLDVQIPRNKLIPTIPLRLNYLLWLEDLLSISDRKTGINGIDIGTGASCVYPLIAARKWGWNMIATEIDEESVACAKANVTNNRLDNLIKVVRMSGETLLEELVNVFPDERFDFCMCNPPFFSSAQELHPFFKARTAGRPRPKNAFCAAVNEVVSDGGEVRFITKLIKESANLHNKITIYSTMVGHKSSVPALKKLLRELNVSSFKESEFCQGRTTRWGLAWTFSDLDLRKVSHKNDKKPKVKAPLKYVVTKVDEDSYNVENYAAKLVQMFDRLSICYEPFKNDVTKNMQSYLITAYTNTWSHQRRKKRALKSVVSMEDEPVCEEINSSGSLSTSNESAEMEEERVTPKREHEEDEEIEGTEGFFKKIKIGDCDGFHLKGLICVRQENGCIVVELNSVESTTDRERLHQILQYIKNNLK